jgi:eukaryotic-like serine/threonine-protein kinase
MTLAAGTRFGPYIVGSMVGAGGMGEVYRARDEALHRDVAVKILPEVLALDPDRLARFSREAQTLAALNHSNIAHIHGLVDTPLEGGRHLHALVMEWVDGEDLAQRIARGRLAVDEALALARQVADALETAHEQGIVHRDIKPANIKVKSDGTVKVLDFGLAKSLEPALAVPGHDPLASPTITSPALTAMGLVLGTAAYMAPEQARGRPVDRRADIWAFGVVLVEMLTGRRLFHGDNVSDVMVSVLSAPIDLAGLPADVPSRVREVIARCLERDPKKRLRDIGEARVALETSLGDVPTSGLRSAVATGATLTIAAGVPRTRTWVPAIAIAAFVVALAVAGTLWMRPGSAPGTVARLQLEIGPPWGEELVVESNAGAVVISPDGSMVAFLAQGLSGRRLYVRSLRTGDLRVIDSSAEAHYPFWSPDSRSLAFFGSGKLLTVSIAGGLPEVIADIQQGRGGTWTDAGVILFTPNGGGVIHRVNEHGGPVEAVTALDTSRGENAHYWPVALPGGRSFVFFVRSTRPENNGIYFAPVDRSTAPVRLVTALSSGVYASGADGTAGHLLWVRDGELLSQPFDVTAGRLTGEVATVASDVRVEESQRGLFASVSDTGTLVWASAKAADLQFAWFGRDGRRLETIPIAPGKVMQPRISPDGRKLAFTRAANGTADIWLFDVASAATTQVTTDPDYDENPAWSPNGRALLHGGRVGLQVTTIDGSRPTRTVVGDVQAPQGRFMPNGSSIVISREVGRGGANVSIVSLDHPEAVEELTSGTSIVKQPTASPDGRWLAFVIDRRGASEVVLARLIQEGNRTRLSEQRVPVSLAGGFDPDWRSDGREILYLAPDRTIMAVSVTTAGDGVSIGKPQPLFRVTADAGGSGSSWTSNADHTKFIVVEAAQTGTQTFRVLTHWRR